ncbi:proton-conducting transporter membrane subunit [Paralimibaculum aggregatum]|uniref:Proton-conducting transporter membrane subunit n=1 Tax=Paralimibaculum aggregatum TaxID=3036245 RepID=A0ABQ6LRZ0_9RHOB|nr:proton-conducting transporter membrane subunit [Limibaculum sp. NKW23]GMG84336.1 proton-conducting transporter membrane subunit [Limibaculum sp. NKW23]
MESETLLWMSLGIPAAAAFGIPLAGRWPNIREGVTLVAAGALFLTVMTLLLRVLDGERPEAYGFEVVDGVALALAVEPLGMLFASVASTLWIVNSIYSIGYMRGNNEPRQTPFYICFAVAIAAAIGVAFSANLFTLFLFYEILTVSTYPLVAHKANEDARTNARVYLVLLMATSMVLLLPAIIWTYVAAGSADFIQGGLLAGAGLSAGMLTLLYALYIFGIGKAAVMPVHFWLPAAMVAPTPVSALLHAVAVVKAGVFCVIKVTVYVFGLDLLTETGASQPIAYVAGFTVIMASLIALMHDNLKKRLAFSTVSQLSYVVMAAAVASPLAILGAAMHIAAHAVSKITLFFGAGCIYTAAHLTKVSELDGIGRRMPVTMTAFLVGTLSIIGLPPLIGVWSKWWIGVGAVDSDNLWVVAVLMISSLLNVAYLVPIASRGFFMPPKDAKPGEPIAVAEAPLPCLIAICVTAGLCVVLFFGVNELEALLLPITEGAAPAAAAQAPADLAQGAIQ